MPNAESVLREVTAKLSLVVTRSSRRSNPAVKRPSGSVSSFCQVYCRWVVVNGKSPKPVCETLSSVPSPAASCDTQYGASRLRLATCHVSTVVIVRSSDPGPPSYWAFSRLRRYCAVSCCPCAQGSAANAETLSLS